MGSKACTVFCCSDTGIGGLKSTYGTDVTSACFLHLYCPVQIEGLQQAEPLSKGSYKISKMKTINSNKKI